MSLDSKILFSRFVIEDSSVELVIDLNLLVELPHAAPI
jgi:hypothetical protein